MAIKRLIDPDNSPVLNIILDRVMLTAEDPMAVYTIDASEEALLYPLIGQAYLVVDSLPLGLIQSKRDTVMTPVSSCIRFAPGPKCTVCFTTMGQVADILIVTTYDHKVHRGASLPFRQEGNILTHDVAGTFITHSRKVTEIIPPPGFSIHCGETLNIPGGWSSFPAHASPETAQALFQNHQELFYVISPGKGMMVLDGYYSNGEKASGVIEITNNEAFVTPLGSHPIVFEPATWGWYFWAYVSTAIRKTYNQFAHQRGLKEYVE